MALSRPWLVTSGDVQSLADIMVRRRLLWSHSITRLGTQAWLFIAPLVLLRFTPHSLVGPACWGVCTMLATTLLGPSVGMWADQTNRNKVITIGVLMQALAVLGSTGLLLGLSLGFFSSCQVGDVNVMALTGFTVFGMIEKIGAMLSDVSVKREWAPRLFQGNFLTETNSAMSQIDLVTEMVGPFLAGLLLSLAQSSSWMRDLVPGLRTPADIGFAAVGVLNTVSFFPQLALLRSIYTARSDQLQPLKPEEVHRKSIALAPQAGAWSTWYNHPGGIQFLTISYSFLYLTVLSPHGVFLTAYLMQREVPPLALSLLRGVGAVLGVLGVFCRRAVVGVCGERATDSGSVVSLAASVCIAMVAFEAAPQNVPGISAPLFVFMLALCLGRPGLYAFELGVLNTEQALADARHRSTIGAIDNALTSAFTLVMYCSGFFFNSPEQFPILASCSVIFVTCGALVYLSWTICFHSHEHVHFGDQEFEEGHGHKHGHGGAHGHGPCHAHAHTLQETESMVTGNGVHDHLHFHEPSSRPCAIM